MLDCFECGTTIDASEDALIADRFLEHARSQHDWPYPDQAIRNYAEATQRLTGPEERLETIGEVSVHPVTSERVDDWLAFFDHDAFVGKPEWAACYCLEPHVRRPDVESGEAPHWQTNRDTMAERLGHGRSFGYLAYVDGRAAGWVNASRRADYSLYRTVAPDGPDGERVVGVSCFIIAPPYRHHGVAHALLDRVIADASDRGAEWVEGYPRNDGRDDENDHFRGPRSMYDARGFEEVARRDNVTVMRRSVG